jgi:hypothetical protein
LQKDKEGTDIMKRTLTLLGLGTAALFVAGCSADKSGEAAPEVAVEAQAVAGGEAVVFENNDTRGQYTREFAYNWPAAVSAVPELVTRFSAERDKAMAEQRQDFEDAIREFAGQDCIGCVNRSYAKEWAVVADVPRFLSLSATIYVYSGGAHGNGTFDGLVWDREAGAAITTKDFFASPGAMEEALGADWCAALRQERTKRVGVDYGEDPTFPCPPIADLVVLPASAGKQAFERIGLLAAPYVAGSYAEGGYEVTLPVTPQVIAALKPEYRPYFAAAK